MNKREKCTFLCLDKHNPAIRDFITTYNFQGPVLWLDKRHYDGDLDNFVQTVLDENENTTKYFVVDANLSGTTVILAMAFLKLAVHVCVVVESLSEADMPRMMRIFHYGGVCMSLEDLQTEISFQT